MKPLSKLVCAIAILCMTCASGFAQTPAVAAGGVLNGASFDRTGAVSPGSLVSVFGTELAGGLTINDTVPLATTLNGVSVTFNNQTAPLYFVSSGQINAQIPWEVQSGTAQVVVKRGNATSAPQPFQVAPAVPGIFALNPTGTGQALAYGNSDGAYAAPSGSLGSAPAHPAKINDPTSLVILATGLGPVDPAVPTGNVPRAGVLSKTVTTPTVLVGGVAANVVFSGMSPYVGVYQLNIVIQPGTPTGDKVPLQIRMGSITTTDQITIAVSQ